MNVLSAVFGGMIALIQGDLGFISNIMKAVMDLIHGNWSGAWQHLQAATNSLIDGIKGNIQGGMNAMNAAIGDKITQMVQWFQGLPGRALAALGNLGSTLRNAGASIIQGFLDGLLAKWGDVTNFVGGIAGWIAAHKGPLPYDYQLLQPAGRAIMAGLGDSLVGGIPGLEGDLQRITGAVKGFGADLSGTISATGGGAGTRGGLPDTITLVDADGSILAKTKVVAVSAVENVYGASDGLARKEVAAA